MSDAGEMSWDLNAEKVLPYSVGFGTAPFFRDINAFQMFWHAAGMRTRCEGKIVFNGDVFNVEPETCVTFYRKVNKNYQKVGDFDGKLGGCDFGEYDQ